MAVDLRCNRRCHSIVQRCIARHAINPLLCCFVNTGKCVHAVLGSALALLDVVCLEVCVREQTRANRPESGVGSGKEDAGNGHYVACSGCACELTAKMNCHCARDVADRNLVRDLLNLEFLETREFGAARLHKQLTGRVVAHARFALALHQRHKVRSIDLLVELHAAPVARVRGNRNHGLDLRDASDDAPDTDELAYARRLDLADGNCLGLVARRDVHLISSQQCGGIAASSGVLGVVGLECLSVVEKDLHDTGAVRIKGKLCLWHGLVNCILQQGCVSSCIVFNTLHKRLLLKVIQVVEVPMYSALI
eukprot:Opistho-2@5491